MKKFAHAGFAFLLLGLLIGTGCNPPSAPKGGDKAGKPAAGESHVHGQGPHGGTIFDFGKWHGEFDVDHKKQEAVLYILGSDEKTQTAIPVEKLLLSIKQPQFQVELKPAPQEGDPTGKSSKFVGKHENFAKEQEFEGTVSGVVDGKPYAGDFKEEPEKTDKK